MTGKRSSGPEHFSKTINNSPNEKIRIQEHDMANYASPREQSKPFEIKSSG